MDILRSTGYQLASTECPFAWPSDSHIGSKECDVPPTENGDQTALRQKYLLTLYQPELLWSIDSLAQDLLASGSLSNIPADASALPLILDLPEIEAKHRKVVASLVEQWMMNGGSLPADEGRVLDSEATTAPARQKKTKRGSDPTAALPNLEADEIRHLVQGLELRCNCAASDNDPLWRSVRQGGTIIQGSDELTAQGIRSLVRRLVNEFERREAMIQLVLLLVHLHYQAKPSTTTKRAMTSENVGGSSSKRKGRSGLDKMDDFSLWRLADMLTDRLALWQAIGGSENPVLLVVAGLGGEAAEWDWVQRFCGGIIEQRFLAVHTKFVANLHVKAFGTPLPSLKSTPSSASGVDKTEGSKLAARSRRASNDSTTMTRFSRASSVASSTKTDVNEADSKLRMVADDITRPKISRAASTQALFKNRQINLAKPVIRTASSNGPSSAMAGLLRAGMDAVPGKRKTMFVPKVASVAEEGPSFRALVEATPAKQRTYSTSSLAANSRHLPPPPPLPSVSAIAVAETPQADRIGRPRSFTRPAAPAFAVPQTTTTTTKRRRKSNSIDFTAQVDQTPLKDFMVESDEDDDGTPFLGAKPRAGFIAETPQRA